MNCLRMPAAIAMAVLLGFFLSRPSEALPMQMTVHYRNSECIYDRMEQGEHFTMSLFILSGQELRAMLSMDGPLPPPDGENDITSGAQLQQAGERFHHQAPGEYTVRFSVEVDFEHLNVGGGGDEEEGAEEEENEEEGDSTEARRARRAKERRKILEQRQREEQRKHAQRKKVRMEGDPYQKTLTAQQDGWYRLCVNAAWQTVTVEMDLRREKEFGGLGRHGHVMTLEEQALDEEERLMEEDTASKEGIKDEDFKSTREKLKSLRRLLADIHSKQTKERHRLMVHAATNEHSHSRMVLSSLFETVLFMAVTGFQVYTIRKWFKGAPVLGR